MSRCSHIATVGLAALLFTLGLAGAGWCFHDGGVGPCEGCHTMHNSQGGQSVTLNPTAPGQGNAYLLLSDSPSSVCLNCHEDTLPSSYQVATTDAALAPGLPPNMLTPGGDFAWLKKDYSWVEGTTVFTEDGDSHGHNITALDYGYLPDATHITSPGGSYPSADLHCTSCHDPHGVYRVRSGGSVATSGPPVAGSGSTSVGGMPTNPVSGISSVGTYRLLAGAGYRPASSPSVPAFGWGPPAAMAPQDYNRSEATTQTRVAYGSGMSGWCSNCHGEFHDDSDSTPRHRFEEDFGGGDEEDQYNAYVKTGNLSGSFGNAFLSLVPFETGQGNGISGRNGMAALAHSDDSNLSGVSGNDRIVCLTCHRAHASGWRSALRWNNDSSLLTYNGAYPGIDNGAPAENHMGRTTVEAQKAYYDRPPTVFGANQKPLCEKCHQGGSP